MTDFNLALTREYWMDNIAGRQAGVIGYKGGSSDTEVYADVIEIEEMEHSRSIK